MNQLLRAFLVAAPLSASVFAQQAPPEIYITSPTTLDADWAGVPQRVYFVQWSPDLVNWEFLPVIRFGEAMHGLGANIDGAQGFFRLFHYDDETLVDLNAAKLADHDVDGVSNWDEITVHSTNPFARDSDNDGLPDGWEIDRRLNPNDPGTGNPDNGSYGDPDRDGLTNAQELTHGTDPKKRDTDGDSIPDGDEVASGHDPKSDQSFPPRLNSVLRTASAQGTSSGHYIKSNWPPYFFQRVSANDISVSTLATWAATMPFPSQAPDKLLSSNAVSYGWGGSAPHYGLYHGSNGTLTQGRYWVQTKPASSVEIKRTFLKLTSGYRQIYGQASEQLPHVIEKLEIIIPANATESLPIDIMPPLDITPEANGEIDKWVNLLPVEVVPNPLPLDGVARMKLNLISDEFPNLEEDQMPTITIGGEICEDVVQDKEKLATFYFTPPSRSVAGKVDLVLSNITVPAYPLLANGEPLTLTKIIEFTDDLEKGTQGIFDSILVCIDEAKSRALYPLQEDLTFLGTDVDRFMNRMTHISNQGVAMAKTFFEDQTIDGNVESKMNYLANVCQAKTSEVMHELDEGGVILAAAPAAANAANPVFGSPTFFADVKQWLSDNGKNVYESSYSHARFAVINADQFDYTAWTTTTTNDSIYKAMAANPDAKVIINGALFNYQKELATTTGIVYSNGVKLATSTTPGKKSHTVAELRYWFGQNVDNTPAANAGAANSYKYGGKGHPPVPAAPGANDLHSATGGLVSIIWPDAAGNRKKVTANMDSDLKVYDGFRGPLYGHGVVGVDRDSGMLIILSKDNGITKGLSIFGVQDTLWNSGVDQAVGTDGGSSVALSVNGNVRIKGARHFGNVGARETVSDYMIFSLR